MFDPTIDFNFFWDIMQDWSRAIYITFVGFFDFASRPLIPEGTFKDVIEFISYPSQFILSEFLSYLTDGRLDSIWDLSLFELLVPLVFVVVLYTFIKWIVDLVL